MLTPNSYRNADPLNLFEYHFLLKGIGSWIRKSVPSTVTRASFPLSLISLFSHRFFLVLTQQKCSLEL